MISQAELSVFIEIPPVLSLARNKGQKKETKRTDINKGLKMLVNETRGSFVGAENKKCAAPAFVVVV